MLNMMTTIISTKTACSKDGRSVRISMMMRDSDDGLTELQRSVRDHFAPVTLVDSFGNSASALHKPGARYLIAGAGTGDHARLVTADAIRADAYADSVRAACDAWRGPNASDREIPATSNTGDPVRRLIEVRLPMYPSPVSAHRRCLRVALLPLQKGVLGERRPGRRASRTAPFDVAA
jgi:hypothetical protein